MTSCPATNKKADTYRGDAAVTTLYHGTLKKFASYIFVNGLEPRGEKPSHDEYLDQPSWASLVYLTRSPKYAVEHAVRISERRENGAEVVLFAVELEDLNASKLFPDEDYINDAYDEAELLYEKHPRWYRSMWRESLDEYGCVGHKGRIPARFVRKIEEIPTQSHHIFYLVSHLIEEHRREYRELVAYAKALHEGAAVRA